MLEIIQQILVLDIENLYREYFFPMRHQSLIFPIVSGDIAKIVRVEMALGEALEIDR